jgi:hypothetical protein
MKTILLVLILIGLGSIVGKLDEISHKLDRPSFSAGQYRPNLRGGLQ